jgi:predicted AAA+ superfamily ATPase
MLAVYHLAARACPLKDLHGIPSLLDQAGLLDIPRAHAVVLDGNAHAPGQPWSHAGTRVHTLWGELAFQLGGAEGYAAVRDADTSGTSPGQPASTFGDALNRLCDRLHYLNSSGDKSQDVTRFWFDTRANLRREMEDRKGRLEDRTAVRNRIADALKKLTSGAGSFGGAHVFVPDADVPDDSALRLVVLPPEQAYSKQEPRAAIDAVLDFVRPSGKKLRFRANRLVFIAPDHALLQRLRDAVRTALAWGSILDDIKGGRLNIDRLQEEQAKREHDSAEGVIPRATREC